MFRLLLGPLPLVTYILTWSLLYVLPLAVALWLVRRRVAPSLAKSILAVGFSAAAAYVVTELEYYDIWRHGVLPPVSYFLSAYLPSMALCGAGGWLLGAILFRPVLQRRLSR